LRGPLVLGDDNVDLALQGRRRYPPPRIAAR
jgi:hypothetical protein